MADDVQIVITDKIAASIALKIRDIKEEALAADNAVDKLRASLQLGNAKAALKASLDIEHLNAALMDGRRLTASMTGEVSRLDSNLRRLNNTVNTSRSNWQRMGDQIRAGRAAMRQTGSALTHLTSLLATYAGVHAFIDTANAAQQLNNQLRTITASQQEYNSLQAALFDLANRTRSGVQETTQLYVNFYKVLDSVGIKQTELFRMVETLNKGFQIGGKSAQEAAGATRQFLQALQSGTLRGQELNSVMEQMPIEILNALAKAAGTSIEKLRKLAEQGALTREVLREAMGGAADEIDRLFARTVPTINNAFTILRNNAIRFFSDNTQAGSVLANVILLIAENLNIVIPLITAFGVAWITVQIANVISGMWGLVKVIAAVVIGMAPAALTVLVFAAALVAVAAAVIAVAYAIAKALGQGEAFEAWIAGAVTQVQQFGQALLTEIGGQATTAVGDLTEAVKTTTSAFNPTLTGAAGEATTAIQDFASDTVTAATKASKAIQNISNSMDTLIWKANKARQVVSSLTVGELRYNARSNPNFLGDPNLPSFQQLNAPGYAKGGSFMVGGRAGVDKNPVSFNATRGEKVTIQTRAQQRAMGAGGGGQYVDARTINFQVFTADADSFRLSKTQVARTFGEIINK